MRYVKTRDLKVVAVTSLFVGGFMGRTLVDKVGSANTFFIGTGFRILIALLWLGVAGVKPTQTVEMEKTIEVPEDTGKGDNRV